MFGDSFLDTQRVSMTSLMRRRLPVLTAVLLLFTPTEADVVDSISDCNQFLLDRTPPQIPEVLENGRILDQNRYKTICQTYENKPRFLTLYDIKNKIPVFSAYKYSGENGTLKKRPRWKIELEVGFVR